MGIVWHQSYGKIPMMTECISFHTSNQTIYGRTIHRYSVMLVMLWRNYMHNLQNHRMYRILCYDMGE